MSESIKILIRNNSLSTAQLAAVSVRCYIHNPIYIYRYIYYRYLQISKMARLPPSLQNWASAHSR